MATNCGSWAYPYGYYVKAGAGGTVSFVNCTTNAVTTNCFTVETGTMSVMGGSVYGSSGTALVQLSTGVAYALGLGRSSGITATSGTIGTIASTTFVS